MSSARQVDVLLSGIFGLDGAPLSGGKVYCYNAGSSTLKNLYNDVGLTTPSENPVILDSNGRALKYALGSYKLVVKDDNDATIYTFDNLTYGFNPSSISADYEGSIFLSSIGGDSIGIQGSTSLSTPVSDISTGMRFVLLMPFDCGDNATITIDLLPEIALYKADGSSQVDSGTMKQGQFYELVYDGSVFRILNTTAQITSDRIGINTIDENMLQADSVGYAEIQDGVVDSSKIANSGVGTDNISNGAITTEKIASGAITTVKITDSNVTTDKIANGAITTLKLADNSITEAKIEESAITTDKIADGATTTAKIADSCVTTAKIADSNITSGKIASGSISATHIASNAVTTAKIADGNVTNAKLANGAVSTDKIANGSVTDAKLASSFIKNNASSAIIGSLITNDTYVGTNYKINPSGISYQINQETTVYRPDGGKSSINVYSGTRTNMWGLHMLNYSSGELVFFRNATNYEARVFPANVSVPGDLSNYQGIVPANSGAVIVCLSGDYVLVC